MSPTPTDLFMRRAREGFNAMSDYKTPLLEGLAVVLFPLCLVLGVML